MSQQAMSETILREMPSAQTDHSTLWKLCGSPQGTYSYWFDAALNDLAERGKIGVVLFGGRRMYWKKKGGP